jgi:hypothetical protein
MRAFYLIVIVDAAEEKEYGVTNYSFLGLDGSVNLTVPH